MKSYKDKIVFITGAAHGIGLSLARIYHDLGAIVVGCDINTAAIHEAQRSLPHAKYFTCDITQRDQVYALADTVIKEIGTPDILVNNAGVVENALFLNCPDDRLERTMNVNIMAQFWICKAFLPAMIKNGHGQLCQIASAAGLLGVKGLVGYCASKHAVVGFSNALRVELEALTDSKITVTVVCPGFINTGMFKGVKAAHLTPLLDQEKIAKIIFKAVDQNKDWVLEPFMIKIIPWLQTLFSVRMFNRIANLFKVNNAMDDII